MTNKHLQFVEGPFAPKKLKSRRMSQIGHHSRIFANPLLIFVGIFLELSEVSHILKNCPFLIPLPLTLAIQNAICYPSCFFTHALLLAACLCWYPTRLTLFRRQAEYALTGAILSTEFPSGTSQYHTPFLVRAFPSS